MRSEPRLPDDSVNLGDQRPVRDLLTLAGAALLALFILILGVGLLTDVVVKLVPREREAQVFAPIVAGVLDDFGEGEPNQAATEALQTVFDRVRAVVEPMPYDFKLKLACSSMVNAMALPGGGVVVTSGLLKVLKTEDQLSFVLGHELGHFVGRDHLQGIGRGLSVAMILGLGVPGGNQLAETLSSALLAHHNRSQERDADAVGVAALIGLYGHAAGAGSALGILEEASGENALDQVDFTRSHPVSLDRREAIEALLN